MIVMSGISRVSGTLAFITFIGLAITACASNGEERHAQTWSDDWSPDSLRAVMTQVADWQIDNMDEFPADFVRSRGGRPYVRDGWVLGTMYVGMLAWANATDDSRYIEFLVDISTDNDWQLGRRAYHADDHLVGSLYIGLYDRFDDTSMLSGIQEGFDAILANPSDVALTFDQSDSCHDRWCWCDALFMAPPAWAALSRRTGDPRYLEFADKEFRATTAYLLDKEEQLFYRDDRFFSQSSLNGSKIFWSRGNGWAFAGLARLLTEIPDDQPSRDWYETLFQSMAERIASLQLDNGFWSASLLDPENYDNPESSGTSLFTFGLAWGINNDLLDRDTYEPVLRRGWTALVSSVSDEGKVGWVQPIGNDPRAATADYTEPYATGGFLLTGAELLKLSR